MSEPIQLGPDTSWGSHLVPLMACVVATTGPVLEVGVGHWSTPLLHRYCVAGGRELWSVDEDRKWVEKFKEFDGICSHKVEAVQYDVFMPTAAKQRKWGVVFLDQSPGWRRAADAMLFKDSAEFILSHDYSGVEVYEPFDKVIKNWKYHIVYCGSPSTLVLSDTREIPFLAS